MKKPFYLISECFRYNVRRVLNEILTDCGRDVLAPPHSATVNIHRYIFIHVKIVKKSALKKNIKLINTKLSILYLDLKL